MPEHYKPKLDKQIKHSMKKFGAKDFIQGILNSYTIIFFSKNPVFGVILMIVSFFDLYAGIAGLTSVLVTTAFSLLLGLNKKKITDGVYGFNALLTGLGIGVAIMPSPAFYTILIFISLATLLLTLTIEGVFTKYELPYLTLPFLFSIWLVILATRNYTALTPGESGIFTLNVLYNRGGKLFFDLYLWFDTLSWPVFITTYFKSLGAIIFQYHLFAGLLIAAGLIIYSRIAFVYSVVGFIAAWLFYLAIGANIHDLDYSFVGFDHILTAIAIGCFFTIASKWSMIWVLIITPLVSMLMTASIEMLSFYQLPVFSLPFNIVVILFLYALKFRERMTNKPELVYIQHFSPEKNLYARSTANERFKNQLITPLALPFYGFRYINQGHNGEYTHKDEWSHAWDFVIKDDEGKEYQKNGSSLTDYYGFGKPVLAPADGWIQEVVDGIEDNNPGDINLKQNWGNTVLIRHSDNLFTKLSHLKKGSILISKGAYVQKGQTLANSGNSGRSAFPHLHFQVQAHPYIGSGTLKYPLSQYISFNGSFKLNLSGIPQSEEEVSNIQAEKSLVKAFNFNPGQVIQYILSDGIQGKWNVESDLYNNIYIYCQDSDSRAWLKSDGKLFYFTHFEGNRSSILHKFFLSLYQVPLGYYKEIRIHDIYPPTVLRFSPLRLIQDFLSPFILFIKPQYKMQFVRLSEDIAGNEVVFSTSTTYSFLGKRLLNLSSKVFITPDGFQKIEISESCNDYIIHFIKENQ